MLQADKPDVHVSLAAKEVTELPLPAYRSFQALLNLVPGTTPAGYLNSVAGSPGRSLVTNVNGTTYSNNNARLDGASNMRASLPHQNLYVPPSESIELVNIATNTFDAEQGFAGGAVTVATRSGTNEFHGVIFGHHTNSALKAKNFFYTDPNKPKYIINTYGGTLGGPIRRNKLFFFAGWEGLKERSNFSRFATIPDANQRAGNFSGYSVTLYDPSTGAANGTGRTPFAGNIIPLNRQSAITRKMQDLLPAANIGGTASNYFASAPVIFNRDNVDAKLNWTVSEKTNLWAKYSVMKAYVEGQFSLARREGAGLLNGAARDQQRDDARRHDRRSAPFSPNFLVDGTIAISRDPLDLIGADSGVMYSREILGIPGTNGRRTTAASPHSISRVRNHGQFRNTCRSTCAHYFTYSVNFD
jgi:hypothetical protein